MDTFTSALLVLMLGAACVFILGYLAGMVFTLNKFRRNDE